jgi:hypothetical protein
LRFASLAKFQRRVFKAQLLALASSHLHFLFVLYGQVYRRVSLSLHFKNGGEIGQSAASYWLECRNH